MRGGAADDREGGYLVPIMVDREISLACIHERK